MASSSTETTNSSRNPDRANRVSPRQLAFKAGVRGVRLGLILAILWVGWTAWANWSRMLSKPKVEATVADSAPALEPLPVRLLAEAVTPGYWTFQGAPCSVQMMQTDVQSAFQLANAPPQDTVAVNGDPKGTSELLEQFKRLPIQEIPWSKGTVYTWNAGVMVLSMATVRQDSHETVVLTRVILDTGDGSAQVIEVRPANNDERSPGGSVRDLVELPRGSDCQLARWSEDGDLVCELVSVPMNLDELTANWQRSGWEVRPNTGSLPGQTSFVCARGLEVVSVHSWGETDEKRTLLFCVRVSETYGS